MTIKPVDASTDLTLYQLERSARPFDVRMYRKKRQGLLVLEVRTCPLSHCLHLQNFYKFTILLTHLHLLLLISALSISSSASCTACAHPGIPGLSGQNTCSKPSSLQAEALVSPMHAAYCLVPSLSAQVFTALGLARATTAALAAICSSCSDHVAETVS
mmetsp:Transcript_36001/g.112562  ORF Transcript_36001/g.112562 Transcript_36001/m.112562 type:complete len:159 (-) Transcript_36001:721-1197(-)